MAKKKTTPNPTSPQEWIYSDPHKGQFNVPTDRGYYATLPNGSTAAGTWNAYLQAPTGARWYLWVTGLTANFAVGGSFGQSATTRSWWPRNFTAPTFEIQGQCGTQAHYAQLAEFVRFCHLQSIGGGGDPIRFILLPSKISAGRTLKGKHKAHDLSGYVHSMQRRSERFVNAPRYQIAFEVAFAYQGLFKVLRESSQSLANWTQIFNQKFQGNPDPQPNKAERDFAKSVADIAAGQAAGSEGNVRAGQ